MPIREPLRLRLVSAPAQLPVSLNEIKRQLGIDDGFTDDDALLQGFLEAAVAEAERFLRRALITQTWRLHRDAWPSAHGGHSWWDGVREGPISLLERSADELELPKAPLQSVIHVKTYDDADTATTFSSGSYFVDTASEPGRIKLRVGVAVPVVTRTANGLEVEFVAGYGDNPSDVPEPVRQGILMTAAWLYANRGDCGEAAGNSGARALWQRFRVVEL